MKYFIFLILLVPSLSFSSWRDGSDNSPAYKNRKVCEKKSGNKCYHDNGMDHRKISLVEMDDITRPIYRSVNDSPVKIECEDQKDCSLKAMLKDAEGNVIGNVCGDDGSYPNWSKSSSWSAVLGISSEWFIWCSKIIGYKKIKKFQEDPAKKAAIEAAETKQKSLADVVKTGKAQRELGEMLLDFLIGKVKLKKLPKAQRKSLKTTYKELKEYLELGDIEAAKELFVAMPVDGVVVTQELKDTVDEILAKYGY